MLMMKTIFIILICMINVVVTAQKSVYLKLESNFLNFPVSFNEEDEVKLELIINHKVVRDFDIFLPDSDPDFWVFLDISDFKGEKAWLKTKYGEEKKGLNMVYQSDERKYLENVYNEKHRPQLHFSSMRGWNNDPNGLVYYDGEYHLFFQHNPYGIWWGNMHWGHAVSTDLLHWKQLPEALYPDEVGVAFSGSAVIDYNNTAGFKSGNENVMVAIYTSTFLPDEEQEEEGMHPMERQSIAYSNDKGRTWEKYEGNPVIGDRSKELGSGNDRDPNVFWHEPTQKWVMILFERIGLSIFTSDNLKEWQFESHFETFWECPELFELPVDGNKDNTKWVVYDAGGDYVIGDFNGRKFKKESGPYTYFNGEFYAAQTFENIPESDGRRIQIGWATIESPDMPFNQMMAFPTELNLRTTNNGVRMFNEPITEISKLHTREYKFENITLKEVNEKIRNISSDMLHLKFVVENVNIMTYGLNIGDDQIGYTIRNNSFIYNDESMIFKYLPELAAKKIGWEIIVDKTSIEVFIDSGRFTMVLPRELESNENALEFWSDNGSELKINALEVYEMKSIWK
jgi:fructan beta-fructosidase